MLQWSTISTGQKTTVSVQTQIFIDLPFKEHEDRGIIHKIEDGSYGVKSAFHVEESQFE